MRLDEPDAFRPSHVASRMRLGSNPALTASEVVLRTKCVLESLPRESVDV